MKITKILLFVICFFVCNQSKGQYPLIVLGSKKENVIKWFNSFKDESISKRKLKKGQIKYEVDLKNAIDAKGFKTEYILNNYIAYQTPYYNFTFYYYFNEQGICDSAFVIENACLDCAMREDSVILNVFNSLWNKNSKIEKEYISQTAIGIDPLVPKKKPDVVSYVKLNRVDLPPNGACRTWSFKLLAPIDLDTYLQQRKQLKKERKTHT